MGGGGGGGGGEGNLVLHPRPPPPPHTHTHTNIKTPTQIYVKKQVPYFISKFQVKKQYMSVSEFFFK